MQILIWILVGIAAFIVFSELLIAGVIYTVLLVRTSKKKWDRDVKLPDDEEYKGMYYESLEWGKLYEDYKREVEVKSGRLRLVGEYFDFGGEKAAIIIAGRTESLKYSYYFAEPYRKAGYNILVIDNRSHGYSDGIVCSLGYREYRDMYAWSKLLVEELCNKAVFLMGNSRNQFGFGFVEPPFYRYTVYANGDYTISEEPCDEEWCGNTADSFVLYEQAGTWQVYDYRAERVTEISGWEEGTWWRHGCSSDSDIIAVPLQDDDDAVRLQMLALENGGPQLTRAEFALKEHETPVRITRDGVYIVEDASRWIENEAGNLVPENRYFLRFLPFKA